MEKQGQDGDGELPTKKSRLTAEQKKAIRFTLVTLVLLLINFGYLYAGASLFLALEEENDRQACESAESDYNVGRNATLLLLMDEASRLDKFSTFSVDQKIGLMERYREILRSFASTVLSTGYNSSRQCIHMNANPATDEMAWDSKWSYGNALLFALTIITTIGYGYGVPQTMWGRWASILYGLIGIPLLLACLANFGVVLAKIFRSIYGGLCCCGLCRRKPKKAVKAAQVNRSAVFRTDASGKPIVDGADAVGSQEAPADEPGGDSEEDDALTVPLFVSILVMFVALLVGMLLFMDWEGWDAVGAIYYTFITLSTIGFGDLVPKGSFAISGGGNATTQSRCIATIMFIFIGMALISMCFQLISDEVTAKMEWLAERAAQLKKKKEAEREEARRKAASAAAEAVEGDC